MQDSFRHQGLRKQLIEKLSKKGIHNTDVLDAINTIQIFNLDMVIGVSNHNKMYFIVSLNQFKCN